MIITGGENVYSKEVEDAIFENPKVADAVIIGVPHPTWGETVTAVVVTRPNETLTLDELQGIPQDEARRLQDPAETGGHRSAAAQRCRQGPQVPAQGSVQGDGGQKVRTGPYEVPRPSRESRGRANAEKDRLWRSWKG